MKTVIGIDTGGTYTDAVLLDRANGQVMRWAKAITTPHDLSIGITEALDRLGNVDFQGVKMVSISTTLATNAIVEGHGGRVALLLIGYDREVMEEQGLAKRLPVQAIYYIAGGHDVKGDEVCPLDTAAALQAILEIQDQVDAFAVSGYFSVMNPAHEIHLREMILEQTCAPVVCGHELSNKLNALKRASTVVLNARLLPLIKYLLDSVTKVLVERECKAQLMIVKGDGSLISEPMARQRPVETILSGPAASAIGAQFLADESNAIVIDMGGTTTDIAILENGLPWTNQAGATVGGWQTSVQAADLRTIGIGGDSQIHIKSDGSLQVGPQRAIPLFRLGIQHPEIVGELKIASHLSWIGQEIQPFEFLTLVNYENNSLVDQAESMLIKKLEQGPLSLMALQKIFGDHPIPHARLETLGIIRRAGLTPTDVLLSQAKQLEGNKDAASTGRELVALQMGITTKKLSDLVKQHVIRRIAEEILDKLVSDHTNLSLYNAPRAWKKLLECMLGDATIPSLSGFIQLHKPIIAIGAPVACYIPEVAKLLHTTCMIPPYSEVGNAVGAAVASITQSVEILVQPQIQGSNTLTFLVHTPLGREVLIDQDQAIIRAETVAKEIATQRVREAGGEAISIVMDRQIVFMGALSEVTVRAYATTKPIMGKSCKVIDKEMES